MKLTAQFVRTAKPGKYVDYGRLGLILHVRSKTSKSWVQQIYINGKRRTLGLGSARTIKIGNTQKEVVSLIQAREIAYENWIKARTGQWQESKDSTPTFREAAQSVIELNVPNWKDGGKTEASWHSTLETYAFPKLGDLKVDKIEVQDVLQILAQLWSEKRATAKKVKQRIGAVMKWSVAQGYRANFEESVITAALPKNSIQVKHMPALPYAKVSKAIDTIRKSNAYEITKLALEFTVLTACRSGEATGAHWNEIDLKNKVWTIPESRTKMKRDHRVPLSDRCIEILEQARKLSTGDNWVFPSPRGKELSDNTLSKLLRENGFRDKQTVHGFRSCFRDWAAEKSDAPREISEFAMAHIEGSKAELAYRRTDYFEKRRALMQAWADYLTKGEKRMSQNTIVLDLPDTEAEE